MAWKDSLLDASFRGVTFDVVHTTDDLPRSFARHAYPYLSGADLEDLGMDGDMVSMTAIFSGDDYETRLQAFLKAVRTPGAGELIHPVFGTMQALCTDSRVDHDADQVDQCTVSLQFQQHTASAPFFDRSLPIQKAAAVASHGDITRNALTDAVGRLVDGLHAAFPTATLNALRMSMTGPILGTLSQVSGLLTSGLDVILYPRAWANDVSSIVDGILGLTDFSTKVKNGYTQTAEGLAAFDVFSSKSAPSPITASAPHITVAATPTESPAAAESKAVAAIQTHLEVATAVGIADAASFALASEMETPSLTPDEVQTIVADARTRVQDAIISVRRLYDLETARTITEPLKNQAQALQEAAKAVIEVRPPFLPRVVDRPCCLRQLAFLWYGDASRADELLRLNIGPALREPNFILPGDVLNAYAS